MPAIRAGRNSTLIAAAESPIVGNHGRRSQVVKAEVCKTSTLRFESGRRLQSQLSFPPKALRQLEVATIEAEAKEAALHLPEAPRLP